MNEDDQYRSSTQFRLWSYTPQSLASLRATTNAQAADRVRSAIKRARRLRAESGDGSGNGIKDGDMGVEPEIECLTAEEEQKLVGYYCFKAMEMADFLKLPTNVKSTAVQYLKRFYLSNSPMTYHPKTIMPCALFLSTKTENHHMSLKEFVGKFPGFKPEDIKAAEFLITQGMRFTFDVRHPFRALEGGFMELLALAGGELRRVDGSKPEPKQFHDPDGSVLSEDTLKNRIRAAHGKAKVILKTSAQLTDAYFFYTPSQIWLASLMIVDEPVLRYYLDYKFPSEAQSAFKAKLLGVLGSAATLLQSASTTTEQPSREARDELVRIDKKLYKCRNPEKVDLVGLNQMQKREVRGEGGELDEKAAKKRKLERERKERDGDVFGGELGK